MKHILIAAILGIFATGALAHSPLQSTTPTDEAVVAAPPTEVLLDFKGQIRLTRVTMTHAEDPGVDLDLSGHEGFISDYALPLQPMGPGIYVIAWRGLGDDGHALNGTFQFTVE